MENSYFKTLVTPSTSTKQASRKVKAVDLEIWRGFAVVELAKGEISTDLVSYEDIGAPMRLATNKDGTVKFSQSGKPSLRVAKGITNFATMVHNNFVAGIVAETERVYKEMETECTDIVSKSAKVGQPIIDADNRKLADALKAQAEAAEKAAAEAAPADVPVRELVGASA